MEQFENNAFFWQKLDTIVLSSKLVIDRPKNTCHYKYSNLVYPVDYGYLADPTPQSKEQQPPVDVFRGSMGGTQVSAVAISADILKKDCEVKLLIGCSEEEEYEIMSFLNQTQFQKAVLIHRGNDVPEWAQND